MLYCKSTKWFPIRSSERRRPGPAQAQPRPSGRRSPPARPGPEAPGAPGLAGPGSAQCRRSQQLHQVLVFGVDEVRGFLPVVSGGLQAGPEGQEVPAGRGAEAPGLPRREGHGPPRRSRTGSAAARCCRFSGFLQQSPPSPLPGDVGVAVAAGHVQGRPAVLVSLVNVSAVFHQELDTVQVSRQHGFVEGCHA